MNFSSELLNKGNKTPAFSISIEGRDNGFTTSLELEVRIDDFEME